MAKQLDLLGDAVPDDRAIQVDGGYYIRTVGPGLPEGALVLDLGCGTGRSEQQFERLDRGLRWVGVDIAASPAVSKRTRKLLRLVTFDGIRLPFRDAAFDCVYSNQVLEHVRHPETVLAEVERILRPGGVFIGGTSNLEPYHALSYWNFTPFGFKTIVEAAGLRLDEIRPGIDGPTLIERQVKGRPPEMSRYFKETSPLNQRLIGKLKPRRAQSVRATNDRMLQFCGQFMFLASKSRE
jgi:SAM-dependent methyltransferase